MGNIVIGAMVVTSDGQTIGKVKSLEESAFLVDAPKQFDYWLETALAVSGNETRVDLSIAEADLGGYKMDRPNDHNEFKGRPPEGLDRATVQGDALRRGSRPQV